MLMQAMIEKYREAMGFSNDRLLAKLDEEVDELFAADDEENFKEELADVLIVLYAIASKKDLEVVTIIREKMEKDINGRASKD